MDFLIGGLAGACSSLLTNPLDVVRTRMQLQGELRAKGHHEVHYRNIPHAMWTILKNDGFLALQSGIVPACLFQLIGNGIRLGIYQHADSAGFLRDERNVTKFWNSLAVGAFAGALGAALGSPLLLVKTQLMSASSQTIAVGTQHKHDGTWSALTTIYKQGGLRSLWRGAVGQVIRNGVGSSMQIATYACIKDWIDINSKWKMKSKYLSTFCASNIAAVAKTITMTPIDVVVTRLYNQPIDEKGKGRLYSGITDCAYKISQTEGYAAFYKGMGPSYLRQAPQTVLLLVLWDFFKDLQHRFVM